MKVLSLFSGAGLGDLGLMMAGMEIVGQVEIDDYCQKILKLRWPDVPKWRDIKSVRAEDLPTADLISGGFPCQPFSVAGKQRGKEDDRHLWPEMFRIIKAKRPAWVLGENVPGIIKLGLDEVLSDLEAIGYSCQTFVIPACATDADHKRQRVWILANSGHYVRSDIQESGNDVPAESNDTERQDRGKQSERSSGRKGGLENVADSEDAECKCSRIRWTRRNGSSDIREKSRYRERWRELESGIRRVANGVPNRVDRLKALGNGQHVFTVYEIGRLIMEFNSRREINY